MEASVHELKESVFSIHSRELRKVSSIIIA